MLVGTKKWAIPRKFIWLEKKKTIRVKSHNLGSDRTKWMVVTREELGPGSSPFVSGVIESLRFKSSENSWAAGVGDCCGVKMEAGAGKGWARLSLGSSSVMSSQDWRNNEKRRFIFFVSQYSCSSGVWILMGMSAGFSLTLSRSLESSRSFSRSSLMWRRERKTRCASWFICRCWLSLSVSEITSL